MVLALGELTDQLVEVVAKIPVDKDSPRVQNLRRRVERTLRPGPHGRVDQFAVARQLEGLQEKFEVVDRPELADALRSRLSELEGYSNVWHPELLSLLLELSNRPALLSRIENLPKREALSLEEDGPLVWSKFDANPADTAFDGENIWDEVDFAAGSSDDEFSSITSELSLPRDLPTLASDKESDYVIPDDIFVTRDDGDLLVSIKKAQFWRQENKDQVPQGGADASQIITELQLARETVFMLQGLPTSIFCRLGKGLEIDRSYTLSHSSNRALSSLLQSFMDIGTHLDALRHFTKTRQIIPYMQTFCRGIEERLLEFDKNLSQVQVHYLSAGSTVSLLQLLNDVRRYSCHLLLLSELISNLGKDLDSRPMRCLDLLYDLVCMREALGDESKTLSTLFFSCFKTYTISIKRWMETGQLDPQNATFFVRRNPENNDLKTIWHDWYTLDDEIRPQNIPKFLESGFHKVFIAGKNMVFLHQLNALPDIPESSHTVDQMLDEHHSARSSSLQLPFSSLVESAFDGLVDINHATSSSLLRTELDEQCGLWNSLDALQHVYLGSDLSILATIDARIFELMDRGRSWDDKFLLMEVTRSAFSAMPTIDSSRFTVRSTGTSISGQKSDNRSIRILESISIDYLLPWPVANIITQDAIASYQRISTFLLQIRRSKYAIVRQRAREMRRARDGGDDKLVHALHHNLLWFLDSLYSHFTYFVIATSNKSFRSALSHAEDVDAMIAVHQTYITSLEEQCLLTENLRKIHSAIISLLDLSITYADLLTARAAEDGLTNPDDTLNLEALRRNQGIEDDSDSDWDEENDDLEHEQTLTISFRHDSFEQQMRNVKRQFDNLAHFVADELKGVARADGMSNWNILADKLEWQKG